MDDNKNTEEGRIVWVGEETGDFFIQNPTSNRKIHWEKNKTTCHDLAMQRWH
jgi:hypothetical protein